MRAIVLLGEASAAQDRNAQRAEIVWRHDLHIHVEILAWRRLWLPLDQKRHLVVTAIERNPGSDARGLDAWERTQFLQQLLVEADLALRRRVFPREQIHAKAQYSLRNETGVDLLQLIKAPQQ